MVNFENAAYRDFDNKAQALPFIFYQSRWVGFVGNTLDLKFLSDDTFTFGVRVRYSGEGYEADDSPYLTGMAERKASFWAGAAGTWNAGFATFTAELLGDASSESKGKRASLIVERRLSSGDFSFTPRLAVQRVNSKYVDDYYGVRPEEVTASRPGYLGKATTNVEAGIRIGYSLAPKHQLSLDLSTTRLGSSTKDSPLVDRSSQDGVRIGYL